MLSKAYYKLVEQHWFEGHKTRKMAIFGGFFNDKRPVVEIMAIFAIKTVQVLA